MKIKYVQLESSVFSTYIDFAKFMLAGLFENVQFLKSVSRFKRIMKELNGLKKLIAAFMAILKEELGYEIKGKS